MSLDNWCGPGKLIGELLAKIEEEQSPSGRASDCLNHEHEVLGLNQWCVLEQDTLAPHRTG